MIILGIDPGSQVTGYGLIDYQNGDLKYVEHGYFAAPKNMAFHERIHFMGRHVAELVNRFRPQHFSIEEVFFAKNVDSLVKLAQVRGVCIHEALSHQAEVFEYATRLVKKGVTGNGSAEKEQVALCLQASLGFKLAQDKLDATDGLALAYYHALQVDLKKKMERGL